MSNLTRKQRIVSLSVATISMLAIGAQLGMAWPLMSLHLRAHGMDEETIGLVAACSAIPPILLWPLFGWFFRRFGAVGTILLGGGMAAAALLAFPLAGIGAGVFALRFVIGAGQTLHWVASEAWVNHIPEDHERGRAIAAYSLSWGIGLLLGPQVLALTGTTGYLPFAVAALITMVPTLPLLFTPRKLVPDLLPEESGLGDAGLSRVKRLIWLAPLVFITALVAGTSEGHMFSLLALYWQDMGFDDAGISFNQTLFGVGGAIAIVTAGWAADHMGRRHLLTVPVALACASLLLIPLAINQPLALPLLIVIMGGTITALYAIGLISLGTAFDKADLTPANAIFVVAYTVGGTIGPVMGGVAIEHAPPHGLMWSVAALLGVFLALIILRMAFAGRFSAQGSPSGSQ